MVIVRRMMKRSVTVKNSAIKNLLSGMGKSSLSLVRRRNRKPLFWEIELRI